MSDLRIVSDVPAGSHLVEVSIEELAKRLGLEEVDVPLLMRSLEDTVKNLTVGDVHATTSLKDVTVAYIQGDDDGSQEEDDEAEEAKQKRASVSGDRTGGGDAASKARLAEAEHGEVRLDLAVTKVDPDQRKIFGWASVCAFDGKLVVDKQDDIIHVADLERAAHDFTLYSRTQGDMHSDIGVGRLIESVIFDQAKRDAGIIARDDQGRVIDGWWVGFYVDDDGVWESHKRGERPEFSIGGRAQREPV